MSEALKLGLLGAGQLGGSFALALREAGAAIHITAYDADPQAAALLHERGAVDAVATSAADAVRQADLVMLAMPLRSYRAIAEAIAPALAPQAIVTDLGSVKSSMEALSSILPAARLVPGHPIAGSEKSGAAVARGDLFRGKLAILTPLEATSTEASDHVETLWHAVGADVLRMPVAVHDQIYAYVSHLPHLIAFAAAEALHREGMHVSPEQEMLQRFLRISRSNARMWTDIFLENREAMLPALGTYVTLLQHFEAELRAGEKNNADDRRAATAFLPRILAGCLISSVSLYEQRAQLSLRPFGAGGMRDIVAPAATAPEGDLEEMSQLAQPLADLLARVIPLFRQFERLIGAEDEAALFNSITAMIAHAHALITPRQ